MIFRERLPECSVPGVFIFLKNMMRVEIKRYRLENQRVEFFF